MSSVMETDVQSRPGRVDDLPGFPASIGYLGDPPITDPYRWPQYWTINTARNNLRIDEYVVQMHDARPRRDFFNLDTHGFHLFDHKASFKNLEDPAEHPTYLGELEQFAKTVLGATKAIPIGPGFRYGESLDKKSFDTRPARFAHGDFVDESIHWICDIFRVDPTQYSRFAMFNTWRVLSEPPQDIPLTVCDASSMPDSDAMEVFSVKDRPGESPSRNITHCYKPNPKHRWYYFSNMTRDELLVFKTHDSNKTGARRVAHTAFDDTTCPPGVPTRKSVEVRVLSFFA
jgi:hypothetical protein